MSLSIESIVRSLLTGSSSQSSVSQSDFVDRILRSNNVSLSQFAKSTICRIVKDQIGIVDLEVAKSLLTELKKKFPNDELVKSTLNTVDSMAHHCVDSTGHCLRSVSDRRVHSPPFRKFSDSRKASPVRRSSVLREVNQTVSRLRTVLSTPRRLDSSRLAPKGDIFRELSSSSSSDGGYGSRRPPRRDLNRLTRLKRRTAFLRWLKVTHHHFGVSRLLLAFQRVQKRVVFDRLTHLRLRNEQLDESVILASLKRDIGLKASCFDTWRSVFVCIMETRRRQVEGVFRMVETIGRKMIWNYQHVFASLSLHASVVRRCVDEAETVRILRKVLRKKLSARFSDFVSATKVSGIHRELIRVKLKSGIDMLDRVLRARISESLRSGVNRLMVQKISAEKRRRNRKNLFELWVRVTRGMDRKRDAMIRMGQSLKRLEIRFGFRQLRLGCANKIEEQKRVSRGVRKLGRLVTERELKPVWRDWKRESARKRSVLKLGALLDRKLGICSLIELLKNHANRARFVQRSAVLERIASMLDKRRRLALRLLHSHSVEDQHHEELAARNLQFDKTEDERRNLLRELEDLKSGLKRGSSIRSSLEMELQDVEQVVARGRIFGSVFAAWKRQIAQSKQVKRLGRLLHSKRIESLHESMDVLEEWTVRRCKAERGVCGIVQWVSRVTSRQKSSLRDSWQYWNHLAVISRIEFTEPLRALKRSQLVSKAFRQWNATARKLRRLVSITHRVRRDNSRRALLHMKEFAWRHELLESLHECDDWRVLSGERTVSIRNLVNRLAKENLTASLARALDAWKLISSQKRDRLDRLCVILSRNVQRTGWSRLSDLDRIRFERKRVSMGFDRISVFISKECMKQTASGFVRLQRHSYDTTIAMVERVTRTERMEQEVAMRDIESAARELEADYTVVLGRVKTLEARNEELEKDLVDKSSRLENEVREVEVLLLQLKESKERQERLNRECEYMQSEISQLSKKCSDFDRLQEVCRDQEIQIEALTTKLNEFAKLSASIQLYKNRISLQNEQIVSLQGKLRESISYPPEEVLYSSPINTRSQDLTYASSSLRGLQQAVDRSTSLRATRNRDMGATADISLISGESSRRRRDYYVPRR